MARNRQLPAILAALAFASVALSPLAAAAPEPARIWVVGLKAPSPAADGPSFHGADVTSRIEALGVLRVAATDPAFVEAALADARVAFVEPDATVEAFRSPNDPLLPQQWGLRAVNAEGAWNATFGSSSVTVAVVDTGVDAGQPELAGRVLAGKDFANGDDDAHDDNGHGTLVAGVVAAATDNGASMAGLAQANVLPVKVLSHTGSGSMTSVAKGVVYAADRGAHVVSLSLGAKTGSEALARAVRYAHEKGAVVVAAAGNSGCDCVAYPAAYPNVLAVSALDPDLQLAGYSSHGAALSLAAPGSRILSLDLHGGVRTASGTSFAAPHVSGVVALLLSANPKLKADEIGRILVETARDLGPKGRDKAYGFGLVDASAAMQRAVSDPPPPGAQPPPPAPSPPSPSPPSPPPQDPGKRPAGPLRAIARIATQGAHLVADASRSIGPGGMTYEWSFGDGTTATGVRVEHDYADSGFFLVKLVVRAPDGREATTARYVFVLGAFEAVGAAATA